MARRATRRDASARLTCARLLFVCTNELSERRRRPESSRRSDDVLLLEPAESKCSRKFKPLTMMQQAAAEAVYTLSLLILLGNRTSASAAAAEAENFLKRNFVRLSPSCSRELEKG